MVSLGKSGPHATPRGVLEAGPPATGWEAAAHEPGAALPRAAVVIPPMNQVSGKPQDEPESLSGQVSSPLRATGEGVRGRAAAKPVSVFGRERGGALSTGHLVEDDLSLLSLLRVRHDPERLWSDLSPISLDPGYAKSRHLLPAHDEDPVGLLYDHLRTRLLQALSAREWRRVAIAAPTRGCGASTLAANLALSLARRPSGRSLLMDMNFRRPAQAALFGAEAEAGPLRDLLTGGQPMEAVLHRLGRSLALGLNNRAEADAAELLQEPSTATVLRQVIDDLAPDAVLFDLPPMLENDDLLAFLPQVDGVLLVVDGTRTTAGQVQECERLLKGQTEVLGVVMNRAEDSPARRRRWPWSRA